MTDVVRYEHDGAIAGHDARSMRDARRESEG